MRPAAMVLLVLSVSFHAHADVATEFGAAGPFPVGHVMTQLVHSGSNGERRPLDIHLWYPADKTAHRAALATVYRSRLAGMPFDSADYDPISYAFESPLAKEGVAVDTGGGSFPLLVFSHGATNSAIDYAFTLEAIASHGFIIAAPEHTGDSADDALVQRLNLVAGRRVIGCLDGLPAPCLDPTRKALQDRILDEKLIIDEFERGNLLGGRADVSRVGLLGHSRGAVTSMIVASGATLLGATPDPRVKAVVGLALGPAIFTAATAEDIATVSAPVFLLSGQLDRTAPVAVAQQIAGELSSTSRALVVLRATHHRTFDASVCTQMQAVGGIAVGNARAFGEAVLFPRTLGDSSSGSAVDYCSYRSFAEPVDLTGVISQMTGYTITPTSVPRALASTNVSILATRLAADFFSAALDDHGEDGLRLTRFLTPNYLLQHEPDVLSVDIVLEGDVHYPPGQFYPRRESMPEADVPD